MNLCFCDSCWQDLPGAALSIGPVWGPGDFWRAAPSHLGYYITPSMQNSWFEHLEATTPNAELVVWNPWSWDGGGTFQWELTLQKIVRKGPNPQLCLFGYILWRSVFKIFDNPRYIECIFIWRNWVLTSDRTDQPQMGPTRAPNHSQQLLQLGTRSHISESWARPHRWSETIKTWHAHRTNLTSSCIYTYKYFLMTTHI